MTFALSTLVGVGLAIAILILRRRHLSRVPVPKDMKALKQRRDVLRALESRKED